MSREIFNIAIKFRCDGLAVAGCTSTGSGGEWKRAPILRTKTAWIKNGRR